MKIVTLKDGRNETILNDRDLEDLVRREMGDEVGDKIRALISAKEDKKIKEDSDLRYYEMELDSRHSALNDILELSGNLKEYITVTKRMNRDKIITSVKAISDIVNNEI